MTRKEALLTAISLLEKVQGDRILQLTKWALEDLVNDLPVTSWDTDAIFDAIEQYHQEHGRYPTKRNFKMRGLPSPKIMQERFRIRVNLYMNCNILKDWGRIRMILMTRKEALLEAISYLQSLADEDESCIGEVIETLQQLADRIPLTSWDKETIFDAVEQFHQEHGRYPFVNEFKGNTLPSHATLKNRFSMSATQFLETYYPQREQFAVRKYCEKPKEYWLKKFQEFMQEYPETTVREYDQLREVGTPCWKSLTKICQVRTWNELLVLAGISVKGQNPYSVIKVSQPKSILSVERESMCNELDVLQSIYGSLDDVLNEKIWGVPETE